MLSELEIMLTTLAAALIAATAQYLFKKSVPKFELSPRGIKHLLSSAGIWIGGILYIGSLAVYLEALGSGELSFVYPTFASTFIFIALISYFLLKEEMGPKRVAGIALVFIGIALVALSY